MQQILRILIESCSNLVKMKTATKMYLSVILSTLCIMFYQYQLSRANFLTLQGNEVSGGINSMATIDNQNIRNDLKKVLITFLRKYYLVTK